MADNPQIKKLKIGSTTYDIRDESVSGQITTAIGGLDVSSVTLVSESSGTLTLNNIKETDGKIAVNSTGAKTTYNATTIDSKDASTLNSAKNYADGLISGLGSVLKFKGTKDSESAITGLTSAEVGDVWVNTADGSEWVCKTAVSGTASAAAWEKFGTTDVKNALYKDSNTFTDGYLLKADGTAGKVKAVAANGSAIGLGNVTNVAQVGQNSTVTAGHVAVWHADHTIKDGGALGSAAFAATTAFDAAGKASTAEQNAKNYADGIVWTAGDDGAHTHTVTGTISSTQKHLTATATGAAVSLSGNTLLKSASLNTQNLVTGSIAVGGMVTNVTPTRATQSGFTSSYDSETCCLTLTPFSGYIVSDVSASKNDSAITYATGAVSASGTGGAVGTSISTSNGTVSVASVTQPTITLANSATTGGVVFVSEVNSALQSGSAASAGTHSHTLTKGS